MNLQSAQRRGRPCTTSVTVGDFVLSAVVRIRYYLSGRIFFPVRSKLKNKYSQFTLAMIICLIAVSPFVPVKEAKAYSFRISLDSLAEKVGLSSGQETSFPSVIGGIIYGALALLGVVSLLIIIIAGYKWMMAGGNEETVSSARAMIKNAVIGVIITLAAYAITYFVISKLI